MLRRLKFPGLLQQAEEHRLADVLGILRIFQVGNAQAQDQFGVGLHQAFRLPPAEMGSHLAHILSGNSEKRFHLLYDPGTWNLSS